ncbi:hypothetical protein J2T57_001595 [Natronocella acetinitrilica]|uniref:Uncharacterized protein n=1 Tax=Natronocella acetinitrilica TaxID=414046 RepID=A0AAE3KC41_9GAMM|nr:hypothetical protein [Natronocella acetinitrilica]MCP1674493.1 hypothetical protein [Natronocella acetinitrilica]
MTRTWHGAGAARPIEDRIMTRSDEEFLGAVEAAVLLEGSPWAHTPRRTLELALGARLTATQGAAHGFAALGIQALRLHAPIGEGAIIALTVTTREGDETLERNVLLQPEEMAGARLLRGAALSVRNDVLEGMVVTLEGDLPGTPDLDTALVEALTACARAGVLAALRIAGMARLSQRQNAGLESAPGDDMAAPAA